MTVAGDWTLDLTDAATEPSRDLIGGKAWSVWWMSSMDLPVPPAFVVTTEACADFFAGGEKLADSLREEIRAGIGRLCERLGRTFGGGASPLLVSVRSGAAVSMPGMMDTVLNLGINDSVVAALGAETGDTAFAVDTYARFCASYGEIVLGDFEEVRLADGPDKIKADIEGRLGTGIPDDPWEQLFAATEAVFRSSRSRRAITYRKHYGLPEGLGTAVTIQAMVFGNLDEHSGTGVLFSRNPLDGDPAPYGEFLAGGQGEDVVSGRVDPRPLADLERHDPGAFTQLIDSATKLEEANRDVQDIEFTLERGELYLLQARAAKRTGEAAVRIAADLYREGRLSAEEALARVTPDQAQMAMRRRLVAGAEEGAELLASGLGSCPGIAVGIADDRPDRDHEGPPEGILVRSTTAPDDLAAMLRSTGIVTERGGSTSHAAVVGRALDKPCVVGCGDGTIAALAGKTVTVDGGSGNVYAGELPTEQPSEASDEHLHLLAELAAERCRIEVRSADRPVPGALDLDPFAEEETEELERRMSGAAVVQGSLFAEQANVAAAIRAGCETIVAPLRLPVLLAALRVEAERQAGVAGA
jgi:pyruvate, orthophosphate dikinase